MGARACVVFSGTDKESILQLVPDNKNVYNDGHTDDGATEFRAKNQLEIQPESNESFRLGQIP